MEKPQKPQRLVEKARGMGPRDIQKTILETDFSLPENALGRAKAVRWKCLDCTCGQAKEISNCAVLTCPLWPYRSGHAPKRGDSGSRTPP